MSVPFISAGPAWYLRPMNAAALFILETNTSHMAASDNEAFAASFAPVETSVPGRLTFAPTIAQTSTRTIACDQSYFFQDFQVANA